MWIVEIALLTLLGVVACASWIRQRRPQAGDALKQLEGAEGWIGIVGLLWTLVMLIQLLRFIGYASAAPLTFLLSFVALLVVLALSLLLAAPLIKQLLGDNPAAAKVGEAHAKLARFRLELGVACLAFAAYTLLRMIF